MPSKGSYIICEICLWEDDEQDDFATDQVWGGPNGNSSLTEWRLGFGALINQLTEAPRINDRLALPLHQALLKLRQLEQRCLADAEAVPLEYLLAQVELVANCFHEWRRPADQ